jgi:hypothetical protein
MSITAPRRPRGGGRGDRPEPGYTAAALAGARRAARLGSPGAVTVGRPGSWESSLVQELVNGTVGYDGEYPDQYRPGGGGR